MRYAQSLHNLAKNGGVSLSHSITEFKNYEEQTMRDALNSVINFTIQESELHKELVIQVKTNIVSVLDDTRKNLSTNKRVWMAKLEQLKRQIKDANEVFKREHVKYVQQINIVEDLKKKKDEMYKKFGLDPNEMLEFDNMPKEIQRSEQRYQEGLYRLNDVKKATQLQQEYSDRCKSDLYKGSQDILDSIENQEIKRIEILKQSLDGFAISIINLAHQQESLHKLIDSEFQNIDPIKDVQSFISKNSSFTENERLRSLYKELGLYNPMHEEAQVGQHGITGMNRGGPLVVEKTSRVMAQQLKQLEEERKLQAEQASNRRKQQEYLKQCQQIVEQLKVNRVTLHSLGNQAMKDAHFDILYHSKGQSQQQDFQIVNKSNIDQFLCLLLMLYQPIQTTFLSQRLQISQEAQAYLEPILEYLNKHKVPKQDIFTSLKKVFDYFKEVEQKDKQFFQAKATLKEIEFYKSMIGFCWTWIRLIILRYARYNQENYEKELHSFVDQVELEHHQANQCTSEAIDFTQNAMKYAMKIAKKESLPLMYPLNYMVHQSLIKLYFDELGNNKDSFLASNFQDIFAKLNAFSQNVLGVKSHFQLLHIARIIYLDNMKKDTYFEYDANQNKALNSLKTIIKKLNQEYPNLQKVKPISVQSISEKAITNPIDFFNVMSQEPVKILYKINNSWLLSDICEDLTTKFENYEYNFGECYNKLRLLLDFASICFKQSYVFESDGTFSDKIKTQILAKSGEKQALSLTSSPPFVPPFTLARNHQPQQERACILDIIKEFTNILKTEDKTYKKVWENHISSSDLTDSSLSNPLYYFSEKMSLIIEEDLSEKVEDLDFDKDPHVIVGELIGTLQKFDQISSRKTLDVIKPKLEVWLQQKLVTIREVVSRCMTFETWQPVSENVINSESVVNVFYTLNETLENLYDFVGSDIFMRWSKTIQVMIHDVIFEYSEVMLKNLDKVSQFRPQETLPPLNIVKKQKGMGFAIKKQAPQIKYTAQQFSLQAGMGTKNWIDYSSSGEQGLSLDKLLIRLANLDFALTSLNQLKIRFFTNNAQQQSSQNDDSLFKTAFDLINSTAQQIITYIAIKMTYVDFQDLLFSGIYIGKQSDMPTLKGNLPNLNNYMKILFQRTPVRYFKDTLSALHQTVIEVLLRYLLMLTSMGLQMNLNIDDFFKNPTILDTDIKELINFFTPKDIYDKYVGLTLEEARKNSEMIIRFCYYMKEDDQMLIGMFKTIDTDIQRNREMISRILYRRQSKDAEKFFEDYRTLFGGK